MNAVEWQAHAERNAITLVDVHKVYKLYARPIDEAIDLLGLGRLFPDRPAPRLFEALKGISLHISKGAKVGVIGRNGAGKTTLLKLITGTIKPTQGSLHVHGRVQALIDIGLGFHDDFSGLENIRASLGYNGLQPAEIDVAVGDVVDFCQLGRFLHQPLKTYSLGMKSRLYFACATAINPEVLVIDEVLGAGDAYFAARSAERMAQLAQAGCTMILVTHSMQQVIQFCERAVWIEEGRVVVEGDSIAVVKAYEEFIQRLQQDRPADMVGDAVEEANDWFRDRILRKVTSHLVAGARAKTPELPDQGSPNDVAIASATKTQWSDGTDLAATDVTASGGVSRWPAQIGLKFEAVSLSDGKTEKRIFQTGEPMEIRMAVRAEVAGEFRCRYLVVFFTEDARWLTRVYSEPDRFFAQEGEIRQVKMRFDPLLFGGGVYVFSVAIFDDSPMDELTTAVRYDLLSRSFSFRVVDRVRGDESMFHHPARWSLGDSA